jgi:hypothetical protein
LLVQSNVRQSIDAIACEKPDIDKAVEILKLMLR